MIILSYFIILIFILFFLTPDIEFSLLKYCRISNSLNFSTSFDSSTSLDCSLYSPWEPLLGTFYLLIFSQNHIIKLVILLIAIVMFIVGVTFMIANCLFLYWDEKYRRTDNQLPYNNIIDRVIPIILLIIPSILLIWIKPFTNQITNFGILIIIHLVIIIPIFHYWSELRLWDSSDIKYYTWNHPKIFFHLSVASVYPAIWIIYFSVVRYLRLGQTLTISQVQNIFTPDFLAFLLASISFLLFLFFGVILIINRLRNLLWNSMSILLASIHIYLLEYNLYFQITEYLYRVHYLIFSIFTINNEVYMTKNVNLKPKKIQRFTSYLWFHPYWFSIFIIIFCFLELVVTYKISFSYYLLFFGPIILSICGGFNTFGCTNFVQDVCLSDYLRFNFESPRYPPHFWTYLSAPDIFFGITLPISEEIYNKYVSVAQTSRKIYEKYYSFSYCNKLLYRVSGYKSTYNLSSGTYTYTFGYITRPWYTRFKAEARSLGFRWFHSSNTLLGPSNKLHPILFNLNFLEKTTKDPLQRLFKGLALMDTNTPYMIIEKYTSSLRYIPPSTDLFIKNPYIHINSNPKKFVEVVEGSVVHSLSSLTNKKVHIGTIKEMRDKFSIYDYPSMQKNPDNGLNFQDSEYIFQKTIGVDNKNVNPLSSTLPSYIHGRNQALVTSADVYQTILYTHKILHKKKGTWSGQIKETLDYINNSKNNFQKHINIWAESLHLFPPRLAPPILLSRNLPLDGFTPVAKNQIIIEIRRLRYLSKKAYAENIPEDNFEESHIQKMISMDNYSDELLPQLEIEMGIEID
jgi:hypothetical protein